MLAAPEANECFLHDVFCVRARSHPLPGEKDKPRRELRKTFFPIFMSTTFSMTFSRSFKMETPPNAQILSRLRKLFFFRLRLLPLPSRAEPAGDALSSSLQAEKNFAQMSVEKGIRDSFLANLADDAIVFDPGPVNGKELYTKRSPSSSAADLGTDLCRRLERGRHGLHHRPVGIQKDEERRQARRLTVSFFPFGNGRVTARGKLSSTAASTIPRRSRKNRRDQFRLTSQQVARQLI